MKKLVFVLLLLDAFMSYGQSVVPLYPDKIPNSIAGPNQESQNNSGLGLIYLKVSIPTLQIFLPPKEKANGTSIIICPGGGYQGLSYDYEGINIARAFNNIGVAAFILKYRLPNVQTMPDKSIGPLQDVQQAIKVVREGAKKWQINDSRIGIIGFSAGGSLASLAGTHFSDITIDNQENTSLRPDFMILVYPVISMTDSLMHKGSRNNLLGLNPGKDKINYFSTELQITAKTPPTLLLHAGDDKTVSVLNSIRFYEGLLKNAVPAEMHIYYSGNHGFLQNKSVQEHWFELVESWMGRNSWINK